MLTNDGIIFSVYFCSAYCVDALEHSRTGSFKFGLWHNAQYRNRNQSRMVTLKWPFGNICREHFPHLLLVRNTIAALVNIFIAPGMDCLSLYNIPISKPFTLFTTLLQKISFEPVLFFFFFNTTFVSQDLSRSDYHPFVSSSTY